MDKFGAGNRKGKVPKFLVLPESKRSLPKNEVPLR